VPAPAGPRQGNHPQFVGKLSRALLSFIQKIPSFGKIYFSDSEIEKRLGVEALRLT
jgi:hypothetical protein